MNLLAMILLVVGISFLIYGCCKGLVRMLFSLASFFIAIVAMVVAAPFVASVLKSNDAVMESLETAIIKVIDEKTEDEMTLEEAVDKSYKLPAKIEGKVKDYIEENISEAKESVTSGVATLIAGYLCDLMAYVIVFIVVSLALLIVSFALKIFDKLPVISTLNRLGGIAFAGIEYLILVWIFFTLVGFMQNLDFGRAMMKMIWDSEFLRFLYLNNLFIMWF